MSVKYAEDYELINEPPKFPYGQGVMGYGRKVTTDWMLKFKTEKRKRRVYCTIFSNIGSCWVLVNGERLYLREF